MSTPARHSEEITRYIAYWNDRAKRQGKGTVGHCRYTEREFQDASDQFRDELISRVEELMPKSCSTAVDFGCGWGRFTNDLAKLIKGNCIGLDICLPLLELAESADQVRFECIDPLAPFPVEDAGVDLIFTCTVLQHVVVEEVLNHISREFNRVLRPGGLVFLFENTAEKSPSRHIRFRSVKEYQGYFPWGNLTHDGTLEFEGEQHSVMYGYK